MLVVWRTPAGATTTQFPSQTSAWLGRTSRAFGLGAHCSGTSEPVPTGTCCSADGFPKAKHRQRGR